MQICMVGTSYQIKLVIIFSIFLFVIPIQASEVMNETVNIGFLNYSAYSIDVEENAKISISIQVTAGNDISVYFADQPNYNKWIAGQSASVLVNRQDIVQGSYSVSLDNAGRYYIILDNLDSLTGTSVKVIMDVSYSSSDGIIATILIVIAIIIGILVIRGITNMGKPRPGVQQIPSRPSNKDYQLTKNQQKYIECKSCDHISKAPVKWCSECGTSLGD